MGIPTVDFVSQAKDTMIKCTLQVKEGVVAMVTRNPAGGIVVLHTSLAEQGLGFDKLLPESAVNKIVDLGKATIDGLVKNCHNLQKELTSKITQTDLIKDGISRAQRKLVLGKNIAGIALVILGAALSAAAFYYKNSTVQPLVTKHEKVNAITKKFNALMKEHNGKVMGLGIACTALGTACLMTATYRAGEAHDALRELYLTCLSANRAPFFDSAAWMKTIQSLH